MKTSSDRTAPIIVWVLIGIVITAGLFFVINAKSIPQEKLDSLAVCLADSGAKFYGAFWCSHCAAQKELFGNSAKLPYIECSAEDAQGQLAVCAEAGISAYPTWRFANGQTRTGNLTLEELSAQSGCEIAG